jgi:multiple sugar transport system permease protein/raffinose/stachyose/melibiose transport system permease protein
MSQARRLPGEKTVAASAAAATAARTGALRSRDFLLHLVLLVLVALTLYPFFFMVQTSLKDNPQFYHRFWDLPGPLHWQNYAQAWGAINIYVFNTVIVTVASVIGTVGLASLSAYAFARHRFPGREQLFYSIIALMMVPGVLTLISSFMWMKQFPLAGGNDVWGQHGNGLLNSHLALILPYIAGGQAFSIFVLRGFIAALPEELFEAARLDGASDWVLFRRLAVPLSKPIMGTIAIMVAMSAWNDYVWPLIVLSDDGMRTLSIGLTFFRGAYQTTYGPLMAGYVLASLPLLVLFLLTMRAFIAGLTSGALKA